MIRLVALLVLLAVALLVLLAVAAGCDRYVVGCHGSAELVDLGNAVRRCDPGAQLEVWPAAHGVVLVKCICGLAQPDGGAR